MTDQTQTDRLAEMVFHALYGPDANAFSHEDGYEFASNIASQIAQSLAADLAKAEARVAELEVVLQAAIVWERDFVNPAFVEKHLWLNRAIAALNPGKESV